MEVIPSQPLSTITLTWMCDGCGQPIADGEGYIEVCYAEMDAARKKRVEVYASAHAKSGSDRVVCAADIAELPGYVRWHAWHQKCDPKPHAYTYWMSIERVRNLAGLLDFHGHVLEKDWAERTDLPDLRRHLPDLYGVC